MPFGHAWLYLPAEPRRQRGHSEEATIANLGGNKLPLPEGGVSVISRKDYKGRRPSVLQDSSHIKTPRLTCTTNIWLALRFW